MICPNKLGGWKVSQDEISRDQKFGLTVQQPAQIEKAPISITACKYFSDS